ncbi:MAG: DNA-directed RNA polymerase subunit alpha [bacterium]
MSELKNIQWKNLERPKKLDYEKSSLTNQYGKFIGEPFESGYGITIGNALRRILLSSLVGAAVTSIKIEGATHEFCSLPFVVEDVSYIILNIKELFLKMYSDGPETIYLDVEGKKEIKASDIKTNANVEILNPDLHIATLEEGGKLKIKMTVELGRGYVPIEKKENISVETIPIDAIFTPVRRVNYCVENARVGQKMDYDKLIMEIWTNGSVRPDDALAFSAKIFKDYMNIFINFEEETEFLEENMSEEDMQKVENLNKKVDQLELSVRSANCLKSSKIFTIFELVKKTEAEMLKYKNFGRRSLDELKKILLKMNLSFGMEVSTIKKEVYKEKTKNEKIEKETEL